MKQTKIEIFGREGARRESLAVCGAQKFFSWDLPTDTQYRKYVTYVILRTYQILYKNTIRWDCPTSLALSGGQLEARKDNACDADNFNRGGRVNPPKK